MRSKDFFPLMKTVISFPNPAAWSKRPFRESSSPEIALTMFIGRRLQLQGWDANLQSRRNAGWQKINNGCPCRIFMTAPNIASRLKETSVRLPNGRAILCANGKFPEKSFSELYRDVRACSAFLKDKGIERGDKVLLFVRSGYELICLLYTSPSPRD